jgi:hypothetical protein
MPQSLSIDILDYQGDVFLAANGASSAASNGSVLAILTHESIVDLVLPTAFANSVCRLHHQIGVCRTHFSFPLAPSSLFAPKFSKHSHPLTLIQSCLLTQKPVAGRIRLKP